MDTPLGGVMSNVHSKRSYFFRWPLLIVLCLHVALLSYKLELTANQINAITKATSPSEIILKIKKIIPGKQIVDSEDGESIANRPMDDAYLGSKNRFFSRETRARIIGPFKKKSGLQGQKHLKDLSLSDLGAFKKGHHPLKLAANKYSKNQSSSTHQSTNEQGASATSDHLLDVPLGDFTHLNTVEYKYFSFYERIRRKLEIIWSESIKDKAEIMGRMGRSVSEDDEHITSLQITLSDRGEILEISIRATSGIRELDDAAIDSFKAAAPFSNPPRGLIVKGKVVIQWGFVVRS